MSDEQPQVDLSTISPEEFARMVGTASDEDIEATIRTVGTGPALDRIFAGFEERFAPDKAQGVDADIQFVVTDQGQEYPYVVAIHDGSCTAKGGSAGKPKVTLTTGLVPFVKLVAGRADGMQLFMTGKLKVSGDIMFAPRIMGFFDRPGS